MSKEQKAVKVFSLVFLLIGILRIALGVVFYLAPDSDFNGIGLLPIASSANAVKMISIASMIVYGVLTLYFGISGVKAANRPRNMGGYVKLCYLAILLLIVEALLPTSDHIAALFALGVSFFMVILALVNARAVVKRADQ